MTKTVNTGYSQFTHFHTAELEADIDVLPLIGRVFSWTGIPRMTSETGAEINDWKTLHHAHALSSVQLSDSYNDRRTAGILHEIAAEKNATTFEIPTDHGSLQHVYHGARILTRLASGGDHLVWCVKGGVELTPDVLGGSYVRYVNGVEQDDKVILLCNTDLTFTITQGVASLSDRIQALEDLVHQLLNQ